jgi:hypothetical protein
MTSLRGILLLSPKYRPNFNLKEHNFVKEYCISLEL